VKRSGQEVILRLFGRYMILLYACLSCCSDTDMLPRLKEPSKDDNSIEEEKELLEFLFEEKGKDQSAVCF